MVREVDMENITFGDITTTVTLIVGFISGVGFLYAKLKKWISNSMDEFLKPVESEIHSLQARLDTVNMETCKNFLVRCLADFDKGAEISDTELERFWEQYSYYQSQGGNTYISKKVEKLEKEGKL